MPRFPKKNWLSGMDSNHDKELQRLLCYHYTTGQSRTKLAFHPQRRKENVGRLPLRRPSPFVLFVCSCSRTLFME